MRKFNPTERAIIQEMYGLSRPATMNEIARLAGTSWPTAKKYLHILKKEGYVVSKKPHEKEVWSLNL